MNFYLIDNITESFGATGVFSGYFYNLFDYLNQSISFEIQENIKNFKTQILLLSVFEIILSFFLPFVVLIFWFAYKNKVKKVNEAVLMLKNGDHNET